MRTAKPSQEKLEKKQKLEQQIQTREQLKQRLKKNQLTQKDINELVLEIARQHGLIE